MQQRPPSAKTRAPASNIHSPESSINPFSIFSFSFLVLIRNRIFYGAELSISCMFDEKQVQQKLFRDFKGTLQTHMTHYFFRKAKKHEVQEGNCSSVGLFCSMRGTKESHKSRQHNTHNPNLQ